jgi:predicted metal-dependent peptidase
MPDEPASQGGGGGKGDQWDDCEDAPGDEVEQHAAEAHAKVMVSQAAAGAEARGKLSKGLRKLVDEVLAPQVPWEDELRQFCSATLKVDTTWAKPSRRFIAQDLIMPSKTGEGMGEMVVGYDISGSILAPIEARFNAEIKAMHADLRPSALHVIYFHHQVAHVRTFGPDDTLELGYAERGLTNFSPIFRRIEQENWNPDCCVVLTDLCCSDFGPEPTYPVLWASTLKKTAPWGRVLPVKA